jgi:hypothetical protein
MDRIKAKNAASCRHPVHIVRPYREFGASARRFAVVAVQILHFDFPL